MTGGELIPTIAWEQAVYVCLFIVVLIVLLYWFSKQSKEWQSFIAALDDKWRAFNKEQRDENNNSLRCVENSLKDLATVTQGLVSEVREMRDDSKAFYESFHAHDIQAKEILALVQKPAPKPRVKKPAENIEVEQ